MASFESKVSDIFHENPRLVRKIPGLIRRMFQESESEFKRRMEREAEEGVYPSLLRLYDALFIDFYFKELKDYFISWVIDNSPARFTELELEEMRAQAVSHLDFYEIQDVVPGEGSYIKSICSDNEGFLRDVSSSTKLVKWDILLVRCYSFKGEYYATGATSLFSPADKEFIQQQIEKARSEYEHDFGETDYADFAKNQWEVFYQIEKDIITKAKNKKYYTSYGELQLCDVRFRVQNVQSILQKIKLLDEFVFVETKIRKDKTKKRNVTRYQFDWVTQSIEKELESIKTRNIEDGVMLQTHQLDEEGAKMGFEAIGTLYVDQFLCRLETRSLDLANFAVNHFAELFGDALVFKRILKIKYDVASKQEGEQKKTEASDYIPEDPELLNKIGEKIYLDLLDQEVPFLNNLTPREACNDLVGRPLLIEWLKGLENSLERRRKAGEQVISIKKIKKELNIDW